MLSKANLHPWQLEGLAHLHQHPEALLWMDAGLGKTGTFLTYIQERFDWYLDEGQALVIAPIRVACQTWPNEIPEWEHLRDLEFQLIRAEDNDPLVKAAHRDARERARKGGLTPEEAELYRNTLLAYLETSWIEYWTAGLDPVEPSIEEFAAMWRHADQMALLAQTTGLTGKEPQRAAGVVTTAFKEQMRRQQALSPARVHFIDREHIRWLVNYRKELRKGWPYKIVIYDESSDLGDHSTDRFRALRQIRPNVNRFHQGTATPAADGYMKVFSQVFLADQGERLGSSITRYRQQHFQHNEYRRTYTLLPGHDKVIASQVADIALVQKADDKLPKEATTWTDLPRRIVLDDDLRHMHDQFALTRILKLKNEVGEFVIPDDPIEAETAAALSQKLLQFASGAVYGANKKIEAIHDHKLDELAQLADELHGEPLFIVYWWQSSLARLRKRFPKLVVMDRQGSQQGDWNKGKIRMLAAHPQGSEFGLNLQKGPGHDIVPFDMFWSYEKWYQIHKRLARQGQKRPVRSWPMIVKDSADEVVIERLAEKQDAQDALLGYIQDLRKRLAA